VGHTPRWYLRDPTSGTRRALGLPVRCALFTATLSTAALVTAFADDAHAQESVAEPPSVPLRLGAAGMLGRAIVHRSTSSPSSEAAVAVGGELRVHPYSPHGFVLGYTYVEGPFGPRVSILDAAYSVRLVGSRTLRGVTGALYADIGPSIGIVTDAPPAPDHNVLGARASVAADMQIWNFTIGPLVAYHGGVPLSGAPDGWEGALTFLVRVGLVFDADR
jgi:hypothetical protein